MEIKGSTLHVRFEGDIEVAEAEILRFHPKIKELLKEIQGKGWNYRFTNVKGEVIVRVDMEREKFRLIYYQPRLEEFEREGHYELEIQIGEKQPEIVEVCRIEGFQLEIGTKHAWRAATIDPLRRVVTGLNDVLWWSLTPYRKPERLKEAREVYEVATWAVKEKGYLLEDEYVSEKYKKLVDMFEDKYSFKLNLDLTVTDPDKVPGWDRLKKELTRFFWERGLAMEIKDRGFLSLWEKPLP